MRTPSHPARTLRWLGSAAACGLLVTLLACTARQEADRNGAAPQANLTAPQIKTVVLEAGEPFVQGIPQPILPAYESAAERLDPAKADKADDYRAAHPVMYAQTVGIDEEKYRPFGEWEEMQAVWTTYSNGMPGTKPVRRMFAEQTINFIRHSNPKVKAHVIVNNKTVGNDFMKALDEYGINAEEKEYVVVVVLPNQTIWHIDYGPFPMIERKTGNIAFTDFIYYQPRYVDDAIPARVGRGFYKDASVYHMPFPFEGGNIQTDGHGQCLTSVRALSNTGFSQLKVRNLLKKYLGCKKTYIVKDITDDGTGHIDMFFKWISPDEVMLGKYENTVTLDYDGDGKEETLPLPGSVAADYKATYAKNQKRMEDNVKLFEAATASTGKKFTVHRLSMMTRFKDDYGNLPRTFINSTFTNGVNVYPSYTTKSCQDPKGATCMNDSDCADKEHCAAGRCTAGPTTTGCDELMACATAGHVCATDPLKVHLVKTAQAQWEKAMPKWKHVGLRADTIATWSGAIHCITRTIPTGNFVKTVKDGVCLDGTCGCTEGGFNGSCAKDSDCYGPKLICPCNICKGTCKEGGKSCTDDADCATGQDVSKIVAGSCQIDPNQACKGQSAGGGKATCGSLSYEGYCDGKVLKFCSSSGNGAKQLSCPSCCGWSKDSGGYDCLDSAACGACTPECAKAGETGCGVQGLHSWTCEDQGGCLKRKWTYCGANSACTDGTCVAVPPKVCPGEKPNGGEDAGSTGGSDAGTAGSDAGSGEIALDAGADAGTTPPTTTTPPASSGGCTAARTGAAPGWLILLLACLGVVVYRRRRAA